MTEAVCPLCYAPSRDGIACNTCALRLEQCLAEVPALVDDLGITMSRMDRVPSVGGAPSNDEAKAEDAGLGTIAHTRNPVHWGAAKAAAELAGVLAAWAQAVAPPQLWSSNSAARALLAHMPELRAHPDVDKLMTELETATKKARHVIDRPAERRFVGPCSNKVDGVTCTEDLYAQRGDKTVRCRVCGKERDVADRRLWLLQQAEDMLFTVPDASQLIGSVGHITVTQASIRGYLHRKRIAYRPGTTMIRLGDLLAVVLDDSERKAS